MALMIIKATLLKHIFALKHQDYILQPEYFFSAYSVSIVYWLWKGIYIAHICYHPGIQVPRIMESRMIFDTKNTRITLCQIPGLREDPLYTEIYISAQKVKIRPKFTENFSFVIVIIKELLEIVYPRTVTLLFVYNIQFQNFGR